MVRHLSLFSFISVLSLGSAPGVVQEEKKQLSIETIYGGGLPSEPGPSQTDWSPDGKKLTYFLAGEEGRDLWIVDLQTGAKEVLLSSEALSRLAPAPTGETERERTFRTRFGVASYRWGPDSRTLLFISGGRPHLFDIESRQSTLLAPGKDGLRDPRFSPDGRSIAFVLDHDIWVAPTDGGKARQVTAGGNELLLHGEFDWVYQEELRSRGGFFSGYAWSPHSRYIAFLETDESVVPTYPITEQVSLQASYDLQRYPKPGDRNPKVRVGIVDLKTNLTSWIDRVDEYIPRIGWADGETAAIQLLDRAQERLELILAEARTGRSRSVLVEDDPYWVDVSDDLHFLSGGEQFLWTSERSGFRHIYLYTRDGKLWRQLTSGNWQVSRIQGVNEETRWVYYTSNQDNPIGSDLYRVKLDGSAAERLTPEKGTHGINMNTAGTAYLDRFSSLTDQGQTRLHVVDGATYPFAEPASLDDYDLVEPKLKMLEAADGAKVSLLLLKPGDLSPGRKYPVVVYVYGMPGFPTIRDSWGGSRFLFHQFLVQEGYVVAQIDDRTSAVWGHKYAALGDHDIGPVAAKDHAVGVEYLKALPFVDGERMAVWGWSGGGFTTTFHMTHTKLFKVGVAGAPVTDWHLYDSIYTERYMGTPQEHPEAYKRTSAVQAAADYSGRMLIIHGTHDDNVHPQNTIQLMDALIKNRKQFDVMFYPNKTHGIRGRNETIHLWTMVFEYLERHL